MQGSTSPGGEGWVPGLASIACDIPKFPEGHHLLLCVFNHLPSLYVCFYFLFSLFISGEPKF